MLPRSILPLACAAAACSGDDPAPDGDDQPIDTDTDPSGQCGDVNTYDIEVIGRVRAPSGGAAVGASVHIENRSWAPGTTYGTATTNAMGEFTIQAADVIGVEECWGLLGYFAVAELGTTEGEIGIDNALFDAVKFFDLHADLTAIPIQLEEPAAP